MLFKRILKVAGLPLHFTPHGLRHTFASQLLQHGESPVYVQRQLGHASIQLTADTYGKWLPMGNKAAVDALDEASGSKVVAKTAGAAEAAPEALENIGEPWRSRLRRPLLCPLSYRRVGDGRGEPDLNGRPPAPKAGALPGCATPRRCNSKDFFRLCKHGVA